MPKLPLIAAALILAAICAAAFRRTHGSSADGSDRPTGPAKSVSQLSGENAGGRSAAELLADGLARANAELKRVFLEFGFRTCGWCRRLDHYHADERVAAILSKFYVIVKIDTELTPGGKELEAKYGKNGAPSWAIFDEAGNVVIDSDGGKGNVGYPNNPDEWSHYEKAIKAGSPKMAADDVATLLAKLKQYGTKG